MEESDERPTFRGGLIATVIVAVTLMAVWKVIDHRTQPPPPPNPIGDYKSSR